MDQEKFQLRQYSVSSILGMIEAKQFVIPEIQRPFVWKRRQVRDLIDSLYHGYPTGYIVTWKNPDVQTKDGHTASGKNILIDGQQRISALMAAISGLEILDEDFNQDRIKIAFNPLEKDSSKKFAVQDASHLRDKRWIPDIAEVFQNDFDPFNFSFDYSKRNPGVEPGEVNRALNKLKAIANRSIGVIELAPTLDIDEVTEIFIRINSKGTALGQSDFVMSKMAADDGHQGDVLRKAIDYFCHLAAKPEFIHALKKDQSFQKTTYAAQIQWASLMNENEVYLPTYGDVLRVAFMASFGRSRLSELVSLLSGRDFETRGFKEAIIDDSYRKLSVGIQKFMNEYNFKQFTLAIRGVGYVSSKLLNSQMALDFAYTLYLKLLDDPAIPNVQIKHWIQKWFVLSTLTGRYVGSPESVMGRDIRNIDQKGFLIFMREAEDSVFSDTFWEVTLPQNLETSSTNSPAFKTFLAAQIKQNKNSLFSMGTTIADLINISGDIHHIFPKAYLKKNGIDVRSRYNQVANYTYLDPQINKAIGDQAPKDYFGEISEQMKTGDYKIGNIKSQAALKQNLEDNAIPMDVMTMTCLDYNAFLVKRRRMMANRVKEYYESL